jgi:Protein of unknown function (DUF2846)
LRTNALVRYVFQDEWSVLGFRAPNKSTALLLCAHCVFKERISHDFIAGPLSTFSFLGTFDMHSSSSSICDRSVATRSGRWHAGVWSSRHEIRGDDEQNQNLPSKADAGKALIYFLQDDRHFNSRPRPSTLVGLDGQWIGATNGNSYFYFSVDPGERHPCTNWQSFSFLGKTRTAGALHFTAEAGGVYYFRAKDVYVSEKYFDLKLEQIDSDEGNLLVSKFSFSASHPKKYGKPLECEGGRYRGKPKSGRPRKAAPT